MAVDRYNFDEELGSLAGVMSSILFIFGGEMAAFQSINKLNFTVKKLHVNDLRRAPA